LAQIFGEEPVLKLKCHTYAPPRHSADCETVRITSLFFLVMRNC